MSDVKNKVKTKASGIVKSAYSNLEDIIAFMPGSVYWKDKNGVYLGCNDEMAKLLGLSKPEAIGKTDHDFAKKLEWSEKIVESFRKDDLEVINTGIPKLNHEEIPFTDCKGNILRQLTNKVPLRDENGHVVGVIGVSIDISDRKKAEENLQLAIQLAEKREKSAHSNLKAVIASLPGNVYWKDKNGIYKGCNVNLANAAGLESPDDIIGKTDYDIAKILGWPDQVAQVFRRADMEVMEQKTARLNIEEPPFSIADGRIIYQLTNKVPLQDENGNVIGIVGISIDISDRKEMEKALLAAKERAESASQDKSDFLSIMGHELRKPLGNVLGLLYLLKDTPLNKKQAEFVELIGNTANTVMPILSHAHEFLDIDDDYEPYPESVSLIKIVEASTKNAALVSSGNAINLYIDIKNNIPDKLLFDAYRVHQALEILIANGLRFTSRGNVCVSVKHNSDKNLIEITIHDTGIGMSAEKLDSLYGSHDVRQRLDAGLRISLARKIIEAIHGKIWAESEVGNFTKVHLEIPCKPLPEEKLNTSSSNSTFPLKIVLIDDSPLGLDIYERSFKFMGFNIIPVLYDAKNIEALLDMISADTDIVMVSNKIPLLSELIKKIKSHTVKFKTKLVVYDSSTKRESQELGESIYFLQAPICPSELIEQVNLSRSDKGRIFKRALVVEDDFIFLRVIKDMLQKLGFHVDAASTGQEALSALAKETYGYIFLDIELPDINGFTLAPQLVEILKKRNHHRLTKIIAVTSHTLQATRINFRERGISKLVGKPLSLKLLSEVIEEVRDGDDDDDD